VGPSLRGFAERAYIAGRIPNTENNLVAWIVNPQQIDPQTAMPNLGVTSQEARNVAAYLYGLE
jgi:cytochrome c1